VLLSCKVDVVVAGLKIRRGPRTQGSEVNNTKVGTKQGTWNPRKYVLISKVVNPFTRALTSTFIGRRRDFYISRLPSNLENIRGVNVYMNVFYIPWFAGPISHIYKPAISSHFKPRLFEMTSLTWPSINFRNLFSRRSSFIRTPELWFLKLPEVRRFMTSWIHQIPDVWSSQVHDFLNLPDSKCPKFASSWLLEFTRFQSSWNRKKTRDTTANAAIRFARR
jgi:hypothetical protein